MAINKTNIFIKPELTPVQENTLSLLEVAFDALLRLQGYMSMQLSCTRDEVIRRELEERYTKAGWRVKFVKVADRDHFFIDIVA